MSENQKKYCLTGSIPDGTLQPKKGYQPTLWERISDGNKKLDLHVWMEDWFNHIPIGFPLSDAADPNIPQYDREFYIASILTAKTLRDLYGKILWVIAATGKGKTQWTLEEVLSLGPALYITHRTLGVRQFKQRVIEEIKGKNFAASLQPEVLDHFFTPNTSRVFDGYELIAMSYQKLCEYFERGCLPAEKVDVIIVDEIHALWSDGSFNYKTSTVIEGILKSYPNALIIFMTATPQVALGNSVDWLCENKVQKPTYCYNFYKKPDNKSVAHFFKNQDELVEIIHQAAEEEKFLIFVETIHEGRQLQHKLIQKLGHEQVEFLYADIMRDGSQEDLVQSIINDARFDSRVLIVTPVLDAAVSLIDSDLRSLVFFSCDPVRIEQEKGRKRDLPSNKKINLYFYIPEIKEIVASAANVRKKLKDAWRCISQIKHGITVPPDKLPPPLYVERDYSTKELRIRYNQFTLDQWLWEQRQYEEAKIALQESGADGYAEMLLRKLNITDRSWFNNRCSPEETLAIYKEKALTKLKSKENRKLVGDELTAFKQFISDLIWEIPNEAYEALGIPKGNKGDGGSKQGFTKIATILNLDYHLDPKSTKDCWIILVGKGAN